jgi:hypothetical protein
MANLLPADENLTKVTPRDQVPTFHNFFSPLSYLPIGYDSNEGEQRGTQRFI